MFFTPVLPEMEAGSTIRAAEAEEHGRALPA